MKKILIMGLPGSGKTHFAEKLAPIMNAVWFNADKVRETINRDLGFTEHDRLEQARRLGAMCDMVNKSGHFVIADFVCPTPATRAAFNPTFTIWMNTIKASRYQDTNKLFVPPDSADIVIDKFPRDGFEFTVRELILNRNYQR